MSQKRIINIEKYLVLFFGGLSLEIYTSSSTLIVINEHVSAHTFTTYNSLYGKL